MSNEELRRAYQTNQSVEHKGIVFDRIGAIIYRKNKNGDTQISVELLDKSGHSVTIAEASRVTAVQN